MKKNEKNQNTLKQEPKEYLKDWSPEDLKDAVAELSAQNISMGAEINQMQLMIETFKFTTYFNHISHLALHDLLIDAGIISKEALSERINNSQNEKKTLAEILDMDFRLFIDKNLVDMHSLQKWFYPGVEEKLKGLFGEEITLKGEKRL